MKARRFFARARSVALVALVALMALVAREGVARAGDADDGVYGRFDGDLDLRLGAGAAIVPGGVGLSAFVSALYLSSAGLYVHYTDALGGGPALSRSIAAGLVLEPMFLGRFATSREHGPARLDLAVDSFALGLGAVWEQAPDGKFGVDPGLEVSIGLGFPLFARAAGPVLGVRGALRVRPAVMLGAAPFERVEEGALLSVTLAYRHLVSTHLVDPGDGPSR